MKLVGIEFAPLTVPYKRRIETLSAFIWIMLLTLGGFLSTCFVIYIIIFTNFSILAYLYLLWLYLDRDTCDRGGRKIAFVRRGKLWHHFRDFFPLKLIKTCELPPTNNYMFCSYPHGILPAGVFGNFATDTSDFENLYPGLNVRVATLNMHFHTPFTRELLLALGFVSSSKASIEYILGSESKGNVLTLVVGGAAEALYSRPGENNIILNKRKGFVKMALKTGSSLVPLYSFGECELYNQISNPPGSVIYRIQNWFKELTGVAPCIAIGRGLLQYSVGPLPRRHPITTVVGKPIAVPKIENPSNETIDHYHQMFTDELKKLFAEHKYNYIEDAENTQLFIVE